MREIATRARYTKKSGEHLLTGPAMKYECIEEYKQEFSIVVMFGVLEVSESGFSAWYKRPSCRRKQEYAHLTQEIRKVFEEQKERYISSRIYRDLRDEGIACSRTRVARLMRAEVLSARSKRRRVIPTKRDEKHPVVLNILNCYFQA